MRNFLNILNEDIFFENLRRKIEVFLKRLYKVSASRKIIALYTVEKRKI